MFQSHSQNPWMKSSKHSNEKQENETFSFREELYLFLNNTICHCYRHLAQVDRSVIERWVMKLFGIPFKAFLFPTRTMWFCIHVFGGCSLFFFTTTIYDSFVLNPLITTLYDTVYPVKNIPFPAVSICSNNRISRREAMKFAKELWVWWILFLIYYTSGVSPT